MESRTKIAGHPIHPMLIVIPLGLFVAACAFDIAALSGGGRGFFAVAYWNIVGGILGGAVAAAFGWADWFAIPKGTRAKAVGLWHGSGNMIIVALFAVSTWLRYSSPSFVPDSIALFLSFGAIALGLVTAWLGGELVDRLGVGIDTGANLNAPSSLSGRPATETLPEANKEDREYRRAA